MTDIHLCRQMRVGALPVLAGILLVYVAIQSQLPHATFWSNDPGEKLLQVRALVANGPLDPAIPYDPLGIEPAGSFRFAPLMPSHATVRGDRLIPIVPLHFPLLSSLLYRPLGVAGLYVLPILFSLLTLAVLAGLASAVLDRPARSLCLLAAGLASPIFFYSLTFWEHTMAMCMATTGLFLLHRARAGHSLWNAHAFAAGAVMAVGAWVRGDVYFLILGVLAGLVLTRPYRIHAASFAAGVAMGLVPHVAVSLHVYGNLLGPQVMGRLQRVAEESSIGSLLQTRWSVLRYLFLTWIADLRVNLVFFAAAVAPIVYFRRIERWSERRQKLLVAWTAAVMGTSALTFAHLFWLREPMLATLDILGLWASLPILPFAFAGTRSTDRPEADVFSSFLFVVALVCLVGFGLGLPSTGGLQWGPRYALALFPVLILLSFRGQAHLRSRIADPHWRRAFQAIFAILILLGAGTQVFGIRLLAQKKEATAENARRIEAMSPSVIVTDTWWLPEENADLYDRIPFYLFEHSPEIGFLVVKILMAGAERVLLVSHGDLRPIIASFPRLAVLRTDWTSHEGLHLFDIMMLEIGPAEPVSSPPSPPRHSATGRSASSLR